MPVLNVVFSKCMKHPFFPVGKIAEKFECQINKNALLRTVFLEIIEIYIIEIENLVQIGPKYYSKNSDRNGI